MPDGHKACRKQDLFLACLWSEQDKNWRDAEAVQAEGSDPSLEKDFCNQGKWLLFDWLHQKIMLACIWTLWTDLSQK